MVIYYINVMFTFKQKLINNKLTKNDKMLWTPCTPLYLLIIIKLHVNALL